MRTNNIAQGILLNVLCWPEWEEGQREGLYVYVGFPNGAGGKEPACQCRRHKRCGFDPMMEKDPLEKEMAIYSSILAWRIPWTEEPGKL